MSLQSSTDRNVEITAIYWVFAHAHGHGHGHAHAHTRVLALAHMLFLFTVSNKEKGNWCGDEATHLA